jgi:hypothetical protein
MHAVFISTVICMPTRAHKYTHTPTTVGARMSIFTRGFECVQTQYVISTHTHQLGPSSGRKTLMIVQFSSQSRHINAPEGSETCMLFTYYARMYSHACVHTPQKNILLRSSVHVSQTRQVTRMLHAWLMACSKEPQTFQVTCMAYEV